MARAGRLPRAVRRVPDDAALRGALPARLLEPVALTRASGGRRAASVRPLIEQHFGESAPWSLGIEEEVLILDADTLALAPGVEALLAGVEGRELPGVLKMELLASMVELQPASARPRRRRSRRCGSCAPPPTRARGRAACASPRPGRTRSAFRRRRTSRPTRATASSSSTRASRPGARRSAGCTSTSACPGPRSACGRWRESCPGCRSCWRCRPTRPISRVRRPASRRRGPRCSRCCLAPRRRRCSARTRSGRPSSSASSEIGLADGYTRFWWDIRPHPRFGTLEVRAPDQPTSVEITAALAALLQALCVTVLAGEPPAPANRGDYAQNRWAALRFGPRAQLIHPTATGSSASRS